MAEKCTRTILCRNIRRCCFPRSWRGCSSNWDSKAATHPEKSCPSSVLGTRASRRCMLSNWSVSWVRGTHSPMKCAVWYFGCIVVRVAFILMSPVGARLDAVWWIVIYILYQLRMQSEASILLRSCSGLVWFRWLVRWPTSVRERVLALCQSCVKVEVADLGSTSLVVLMVTWIKATLNLNFVRAQEPCEIRGNCPGLPPPPPPPPPPPR